MFIIDFDDTLFDTQRYKRIRLECVQRLGVSEEEYWTTYKQARNSHDGIFTYSDERHTELLALLGYNHDEVLTALQETSAPEALPEFLFEDTISFLDDVKAYGDSMVLLSLGNPGYQELKTKQSGVSRYFDRTFMVHDTKKHILATLFEEVHPAEVYFINDKVAETIKLQAAFPQMRVVLKVSENIPKEAYEQSGLPYFESLSDIATYVREQK